MNLGKNNIEDNQVAPSPMNTIAARQNERYRMSDDYYGDVYYDEFEFSDEDEQNDIESTEKLRGNLMNPSIQMEAISRANAFTLEKLHALEDERNSLETSLQELLDELDEKEQRIGDLMRENYRLSADSANNNSSSLQGTNNFAILPSQVGKNEGYKQKYEELLVKYEILLTKNQYPDDTGRSSQEQNQNTISGFKKQLEILNQSLVKAQLAYADLEAVSSLKITQLTNEREAAVVNYRKLEQDCVPSSKFESINSEVIELRNDNLDLKKELDNYVTIRNTVAGLEAQVRALQNQKKRVTINQALTPDMEELLRTLEAEKKLSENCQRNISKLVDEKRDIEGKVEQLESEIKRLKNNSNETKQELNVNMVEKNAELARLNMAMSRKGLEISQLKSDVKSKTEEIETLRAQLAEANEKYSKIQSELSALHDNLLEKDGVISELTKRCEEFDIEKMDVEESMMEELLKLSTKANEVRTALEKELAEKNEQIKQLKGNS